MHNALDVCALTTVRNMYAPGSTDATCRIIRANVPHPYIQHACYISPWVHTLRQGIMHQPIRSFDNALTYPGHIWCIHLNFLLSIHNKEWIARAPTKHRDCFYLNFLENQVDGLIIQLPWDGLSIVLYISPLTWYRHTLKEGEGDSKQCE